MKKVAPKKTDSIKKKKVRKIIISLDEKEKDINSPEKKKRIRRKKCKLKDVQNLDDKFNTKETFTSYNSNEKKEKLSSNSQETIKNIPKSQSIKNQSLEKAQKKETKSSFEQKFEELKKCVKDELGHFKNQLNHLKQQNLKLGLKLEIINQAGIHQDKIRK